MPLDAGVAAMLEQMQAMDLPNLYDLEPLPGRTFFRQLSLAPLEARSAQPEVAEITNRSIPGPAGELPVRVYRPLEPLGERPPLLLFCHGGGWVIGDLDTHDEQCRSLCAGVGAVVVSVDYRLAPENPYPAPLDDCWAALQWAAGAAEELGTDAQRLVVGGDSAGGNLTAALTLRARSAGGPALAAQLLIYPVTDTAMDTASYTENAEGYFLEAKTMQWFWGHYRAAGPDAADPELSPLAAEDLANLPPAVLVTAEFDPLRDEGDAYGDRLVDAGVVVRRVKAAGLIHGFFSMGPDLPAAQHGIDETCSALKDLLQGA